MSNCATWWCKICIAKQNCFIRSHLLYRQCLQRLQMFPILPMLIMLTMLTLLHCWHLLTVALWQSKTISVSNWRNLKKNKLKTHWPIWSWEMLALLKIASYGTELWICAGDSTPLDRNYWELFWAEPPTLCFAILSHLHRDPPSSTHLSLRLPSY